MKFQRPEDTICALSTAQGMAAIAVIRVSGNQSLSIVESIFSKTLASSPSHSAHFGRIADEKGLLDEVVVTVFKQPNSFTGEDTVEIACHGSPFIQSQLLQLLIAKGARLAEPGEFSLRAFLNKKIDLSQAEAIADLIAARTAAAHTVAIRQIKGTFAAEIRQLKQQLMEFAALIELELDFSEEDVAFADRSQLTQLLHQIDHKVSHLADSFKTGNAIKHGVPVAIIGAPNVGKSTLLNRLVNDEKAIVSEMAGTTRDVIEEVAILEGIAFRFVDTAGIRRTDHPIESIGIERAYRQIEQAYVVLFVMELAADQKVDDIIAQIDAFKANYITGDQRLICLFNKSDRVDTSAFGSLRGKGLFISAKNKEGLDALTSALVQQMDRSHLDGETVVTNTRHYALLSRCQQSIARVNSGLEHHISGDLLAIDIRETLDLMGEITGEITSDDILGTIFANFCIGK